MPRYHWSQYVNNRDYAEYRDRKVREIRERLAASQQQDQEHSNRVRLSESARG